jgi:hypothetical protein
MPTQQRSLTQPYSGGDTPVDRGTLATASPLLKEEFCLTNSQIGLFFPAFPWSYASLQNP